MNQSRDDKKGRFAPQEQGDTAYIGPADEELSAAKSLPDIMNIISRRAQARGLTELSEEKIEEILRRIGE